MKPDNRLSQTHKPQGVATGAAPSDKNEREPNAAAGAARKEAGRDRVQALKAPSRTSCTGKSPSAASISEAEGEGASGEDGEDGEGGDDGDEALEDGGGGVSYSFEFELSFEPLQHAHYDSPLANAGHHAMELLAAPHGQLG